MEPLQWLFISLALVLAFLVFSINPIQGATDEAIKTSARLEARRIASTINLMATAPEGTSYTVSLPNTRCTIRITGSFVVIDINKNGQELSETFSILKTVPVIADQEFNCKETPAMKLTKTGGVLRITRG